MFLMISFVVLNLNQASIFQILLDNLEIIVLKVFLIFFLFLIKKTLVIFSKFFTFLQLYIIIFWYKMDNNVL